MRLLVRLSAMVALLCSLVMVLVLAGSAVSFFYLNQYRTERHIAAFAEALDRALQTESLPDLMHWLPYIQQSGDIRALEIRRGSEVLYRVTPSVGVNNDPWP